MGGEGRSWRVAVKRSSTWVAREGSRKADGGCDRESINPKGARVVSRLQTSGRRIFSEPKAGRRKASR
jgi:hypothetical protein